MKTFVQNKKSSLMLLIVLLVSVVGMKNVGAQNNVPTGSINGVFSVSENTQVYFSQGNLQYQASTNTWRFAENQWDFVGTQVPDNIGNVGGTVNGSDNINISSTYSGWIDLFGWGTSGYNHGAVCNQPWCISDNDSDYYAYGNPDYNLNDQTSQADWGFNAISNGGNTENCGWRTLTQEEWRCLFNTRTTPSGIRYAKALVNGINGMILLPDNWSENYYGLNNTNSSDASFESNVITASQWNTLEQHGAVFLPAAGERSNPTWDNPEIRIFDVNYQGYYWSASCFNYNNGYYAFHLNFNENRVYYYTQHTQRQAGMSVRLVHTIENPSFGIYTNPNPAEGGVVIGAGTYEDGAVCTVTATASEGYNFVNWTVNGEVISTDANYSFTVAGGRTMVANFRSSNTNISNGALSGHFSVNADLQIRFSQGNLQYIGSSVTPYWKFAEHQWDYLGDNGQCSSGSQTENRDFFSWGTSGYNHGAIYYQPWDMSSNERGFYAYGNTNYNLYDQTGQADWGYNAIINGGNTENSGWRTLTREEWSYIFNTRSTTSGIRFAMAQVNGINGVILLPDDWSDSVFSLSNTNTKNANFNSNVISASQWVILEQYGAIFLPAAGRRSTTVNEFGFKGYYWSASRGNTGVYDNNYLASDIYYPDSYLNTYHYRYYGQSVRLVRPVENVSYGIIVTPNPLEGGTVTGAGEYEENTTCTLTATPNADFTFLNWTENGTVVSTNSTYTFTVTGDRTLVANFNGYISFADSWVRNACIEYWDTNNDGRFSYSEAAAVTDSDFEEAFEEDELFYENSSITSFNELRFFTGLTTIPDDAFDDWYNLNSITLPNSISSIGAAFYNCNSLTSIVIPNSVISIGQFAFFGCSGLTSITIPDSVISIGYRAFSKCSGIEQIIVALGNSIYDSRENCNAIINSNTNELVLGCKNTVIPNTVTSIGGSAFYGCSGLTSITIPNSIISIGNDAFSYCSGLTSIALPNSVISIGQSAFSYCSGLTSIALPNSVTSIEQNAFSYCSGLISIVIPYSVTSLGQKAFYRCNHLCSIKVASGNAVYDSRGNCNAIINSSTNELILGCKNTVIPNTVTSIGSYAFDYHSDMTSMVIPNSVTSIGNFAFSYCTNLSSIEIPNSVISIGQSAFHYCYGLTSIEIPNSVISIGQSAFYYCYRLASMNILAETPPTIGLSTFYHVERSIPVNVPCGSMDLYQTASGWNEFTNYQGLECPRYTITATASPTWSGSVAVANQVTNSWTGETINHAYGIIEWNGTPSENVNILTIRWKPDGYSYWQTYILSFNAETGLFDIVFDEAYYFSPGQDVDEYVYDDDDGIYEAEFEVLWYSDNVAHVLFHPEDHDDEWEINVFGGGDYGSCEAIAYIEGGVNQYNYGETCTLAAIANEGFIFVNWTENGEVVSTDATYTFTVTGERNLVANFSPNSYTITAIANPAEAGTISGTGSYDYGETCTLTATTIYQYSDYQYQFLNWTENGNVVSTDNTISFVVTGNRQLIANFSQINYHWAWPSGMSGNMTILGILKIDGVEPYADYLEVGAFCGEDCRGSALPAMNMGLCVYYLNVCGNNEGDPITFRLYDHQLGQELDLHCTNELTFSDGQFYGSDEFYVFNFFSYVQITATADPEGSGTVTGTGSYYNQASCTLTAIPNEGYAFQNWALNGEVISSNASYTFEVNGAANYVAHFSLNSYDITVTADPTEGGTITGGGTYDHFATCTLTATASIGYTFENWTLNGEVVSNDFSYSFEVSGADNYVAHFSLNSYDITATADPTEGGTVTGGGTYDHFATCTLSATANTGYTFENWTLNGEVVSTEPTYSFEVSGTVDFVAHFVLNSYEIVAMASPSNGGIIIGSGTYSHFQTCTLSVTTNEGFLFNSWIIDGETVSTEATYTFVVSGPVTIMALFDMVQTIELSQGWTWWGTSVEQSGINGLGILESCLNPNGRVIKTTNRFVQYQVALGSWMGSLNSLTNEEGYRVQTVASCTASLTGPAARPEDHPITINHNWNWIGYPVSQPQTVTTALSNYEPSVNDVIKGQGGYATYLPGVGWMPQNYTLYPGSSYMYYSVNEETQTLVYANGRGDAPVAEPDNRRWRNDIHNFADNLCLMAVVTEDGVEQRSDELELGAFVNGECRGSAKLLYIEPFDRYYAMMTITGQDDEVIEFALLDEGKHQVSRSSATRLAFQSDIIAGTYDNPFIVAFGAMASLEEHTANIYIYPNPVNRGETFNLVVPEGETIVEMTIVDALGAVVRHNTGALNQHVVEGLFVPGVYLVKLVCKSGNTYYNRLIVR